MDVEIVVLESDFKELLGVDIIYLALEEVLCNVDNDLISETFLLFCVTSSLNLCWRYDVELFIFIYLVTKFICSMDTINFIQPKLLS